MRFSYWPFIVFKNKNVESNKKTLNAFLLKKYKTLINIYYNYAGTNDFLCRFYVSRFPSD